VLALAVAAGERSQVFGGTAGVGCVFISKMSTGSLTFACLGSVSVTVASVTLGQVGVFNEALTVFELSIREQALLHQSVSLSSGSHF
jgi:hypothetical protein